MTSDPYDRLPERIRTLLATLGHSPDQCLATLKSIYKPNETIPRLWVVVVTDALLLCSTHRTRGLFRKFAPEDLNTVRARQCTLEIIPRRLDAEQIDLPFDPSDAKRVQALAHAAHRALCARGSAR